jgi:HK97 family phage portal protein
MRLGPFVIFERKSLADPTPAEFAAFSGGWLSSDGINLLSLPATQSCVRLISEAAASLPIRVEKLADGGAWLEDRGHSVAKLLAEQPNDYSSTFELIRDLVLKALTNDRGGLAYVNRVRGEVREIVGYDPANCTVTWSTDGRAEPAFRINNGPVAADDVIYLRGPFSRCPLNMAADAIRAAKHMERHASNLFENGSRPGGVLTTPKPVGEKGVIAMLAGWKAAHDGSGNGGRTAVLWDGATFTPFTLNSTDAQFLENRKYQTLEICRAMRVPPSMVYELDRATWSNGEQQGLEFLTYTLEPWLLALEAALRRALFRPDERQGYRVRFDRDDLTRADLTARATAINSLVASKVINANEARAWLDMGPRAGGDTFENPNITTKLPGASDATE